MTHDQRRDVLVPQAPPLWVKHAGTALIFLLGLSATWGEGFFLFPRAFIYLSVVMTVYWVVYLKRENTLIPGFNVFMMFLVFHSVVTYSVIHFDELNFSLGFLGGESQGDALRYDAGKGLLLARFFVNILFVYALTAALVRYKGVKLFVAGYGLGLLVTVVYGTLVYAGRSSGGYLDPNSYGMSGLTAVFLGLVCYGAPRKPLELLLCCAFLCLGGYVIMSSGSRGALLSLVLGLMSYFIYRGRTVEKASRKLIYIFIIVCAAVFLASDYGGLAEYLQGFRLERTVMQRRELRLEVWGWYLDAIKDYWAFGTGIFRTTTALDLSEAYRVLIPHNVTLHILVDFGMIGLALYLFLVFRMAIRTFRNKNRSLFSLLVAWLVVGLFLSCFPGYSSRDSWIILSVISSMIYMSKKTEQAAKAMACPPPGANP